MTRKSKFRFLLFVAGDAQNSLEARANLTALCEAHLPDRHQIEVIDVFRDPEQALAQGILMTPTLVILVPPPSRKIVGTLSQIKPLLQALGLPAPTE